jgi:replicative DNA helicase
VVIDYLQLARGASARRDDNRQQEIADISRGLKALAKDLKIPIIAISQLNREVEKREQGKPRLSDLRESGSIEQDADLVLFIHREDMAGGDTPEAASPTAVAEIIIGKHRNGGTGAVKMTFIKAYTRFENYADDAEPGGWGE